MRPSDKVHCVIPHFSRTTPLRRTPAHIAHSQHSTSLFQPLRAQNTAQIPRRLISDTGTTRRPRPGLPAHKTSLSPATPSSEPGTSSLPHYSRFSTTSLTMSSDDAYMSFLDKVNADLNAGRVPQQGADTVRTETVGADVQVPRALQSVNAYYISDTDEPFEPVTLKWEGASRGDWPSADQLSKLISPSADLSNAISTLSPSSFDPKNQYASVLHAVRAAAVEREPNADQTAVDIKVYRVELSSTKLEYWILALGGPESRLVGLRAKAVES